MAAPQPFPTGASTSPHSIKKGNAGFQSSATTGVEVTVYPLADKGVTDPTSTDPRLYLSWRNLDGSSELDDAPSIISCTVTNAIGSGGTFAITVKTGTYGPLVNEISDDSWLDITFTKNDKKWHVLRGLIDEVRQTQTIGSTGAYVTTHTIIGRSFQKVFATTPFYFNTHSAENLDGSTIFRLLNSKSGVGPDQIIKMFLQDMPLVIGRYYERGNWVMPTEMPNIGKTGANGQTPTLPDAITLNFSEFDTYGLPRCIPAASVMATAGTGDMWSIAQNYSDSMFCELFTEQMRFGDTTKGSGGNPNVDYDGTQGLDNKLTDMTVVFRDKPFMTVDDSLGSGNSGRQSPYFRLAEFVIKRQDIQSSDLGVSGYERYNAFYQTAPVMTDLTSHIKYFQLPLWFPADINKHGLRRLDITSPYNPDTAKMVADQKLGLSNLDVEQYAVRRRALVRDWYCQGSRMLSGSLSLGCGAPHLKIGCRLKVAQSSANDPETNFYIEGLTHSWSAPGGTRTTITVTRGWIGTAEDMLKDLSKTASFYKQGQVDIRASPPPANLSTDPEKTNVG